ncbi:cystatin-A1-like [Puntigrus tetrazona]|uniref:cystatin-A1-like n=1 Tax=Puntigrus tetrazona TaxID=1606681 RepID=UPI001C899833|nr:cystatin-A1-like [Puntigrus tetrazona]
MNLSWKEAEDSTANVQRFCSMVRADVEKKIGQRSVFSSLNFRARDTTIQYIAKVHVGGTDYVHVKISQALPCYGEEAKMLAFQFPKQKEDEIEPF